MWRLIKVSKTSLVANFFIGIALHSASYGQNTFNHGTFITGKDPIIINQLIPEKVIKGLTNLSSRLSVSEINSKNAETALKNGNHALAADYWGEIAKDELLVKKSKQRWVYAIIKKSESEEYYNISTAHKTVTTALALAPNDITLLEKAAIIEINLYQLSDASENLLKLLTLLKKKHEGRAETIYLSHLRLAVVSASLGRKVDQIEQTIQATQVYNTSLNREQKNKYREDNNTLLSAAILMQLSRMDTNPVLLMEYGIFEKIILQKAK